MKISSVLGVLFAIEAIVAVLSGVLIAIKIDRELLNLREATVS